MNIKIINNRLSNLENKLSELIKKVEILENSKIFIVKKQLNIKRDNTNANK